MKIMFVKKVLPAFVFYTSNCIPKGSAGCTRLMVVFLRSEYADDKGLLEHELVHVQQFYKLPIIGSWLYFLLKKYRLKCEVEAYKKQLEFNLENIDLYATFISEKYGLDVSVEDAKTLLKKEE